MALERTARQASQVSLVSLCKRDRWRSLVGWTVWLLAVFFPKKMRRDYHILNGWGPINFHCFHYNDPSLIKYTGKIWAQLGGKSLLPIEPQVGGDLNQSYGPLSQVLSMQTSYVWLSMPSTSACSGLGALCGINTGNWATQRSQRTLAQVENHTEFWRTDHDAGEGGGNPPPSRPRKTGPKKTWRKSHWMFLAVYVAVAYGVCVLIFHVLFSHLILLCS